MAGLITVPKPSEAPTHKMKERRHQALFVATCSCGWTADAVSGLSAAMEMKRHENETQKTSSRRADA
jgi:hypothetical protein